MLEIKINHQDGLIYFDRFRIAELILIKHENLPKQYHLVIDIQSYDYNLSLNELAEYQDRLNAKINNELDYVWVNFEQIVELEIPNDLNLATLEADQDNNIYLYFGWHIPLNRNVIEFTKENNNINVYWKAVSGDVSYYDERAELNAVEISGKLKMYVFDQLVDFKHHQEKKSQMRETYFSTLRSLNGHAIPGQDTIDVDNIKMAVMNEFEKAEHAWKFAKSQHSI